MRLLRSFPMMAFILVVLSIVGFCIATASMGLLLVAGALAVMSWYVTEGPRGRSLPRWVSNVATVALALNVTYDFLQHVDQTNEWMGVLGRFTVWLTIIKLYERKRVRDYAQLLALSLLLMITGCLETVELLFGIVLLTYSLIGLYVLVLFQLHAGFERMRAARSEAIPAGYRLPPIFRPITGRGLRLHFRSLVAFVGVGGLALSIVVFLLAPRDADGRRFIGGRGESVSGISDEINLTTGTRITTSMAPVGFMQLTDRQNRPMKYPRPLLLRYAVLDRYSNGEWSSTQPTHTPPTFTTHPSGYTRLERQRPQAEVKDEETPVESIFTLNFQMFGRREQNLLSMAYPVAVGTQRPTSVVYDPARQTLRAAHAGGVDSYTVLVSPNPSEATLRRLCWNNEPQLSPRARPPRHDRIDALARRMLAEAGTPAEPPEDEFARWRWHEQVARALQNQLQSGDYLYITDLRDIRAIELDGRELDPVAQFLTETKRGHCEYFASGLAALCSAVGVPARVVTGYVASEYDPTAERYIIRESNAHAWTEVRTGPWRWDAFDPTPPDTFRQLHRSVTTFADRLLSLYDYFEYSWNNRVVSFDSRTQSSLMSSLNERLGQRLTGVVQGVREWADVVNRTFDFGPAGYFWLGLVGFAIFLAMIVIVRLVRRVLRLRSVLHLPKLRGAEPQRMIRQLGFYLDMLTMLDRGGFPKPHWQPPGHFAESLAVDAPTVAPTVKQLTELFYESRFGNRTLSRREMLKTRALLERLGESLGVRA